MSNLIGKGETIWMIHVNFQEDSHNSYTGGISTSLQHKEMEVICLDLGVV